MSNFDQTAIVSRDNIGTRRSDLRWLSHLSRRLITSWRDRFSSLHCSHAGAERATSFKMRGGRFPPSSSIQTGQSLWWRCSHLRRVQQWNRTQPYKRGQATHA